ncbi:MAG: DMT family transporter [Nitrosomonadales bacterium]|nr:DMT family transporter [Nitrosomonadales bacterium]
MKKLSPHWQSTIFGMLGVLGFSLTLPATRLAVAELDPTFVALGRAIVAAVLAGIALALARAPRPFGMQWLRLTGVAIGVVIGFPVLSTWAMTTVPAAHGAVVVGLLPLATALFGAWLGGERPRPLFWASTLAGGITIAIFSLSSGSGSFHTGDLLLLGAVIAAGFGYAEGARLSRELGAWQTISWALVISAPLLIYPVVKTMPQDIAAVGWQSWCGFSYVGVVSMFLAFVVWYKGLALGGIAHIGQLQLLQPFLTIAAAAMLLHEQVSWLEVLAALIVIACVLIGRRAGATPIKAINSIDQHDAAQAAHL